MNNAQKSLFIFGLYMIFFVGLGFLLVPTLVLDTFGLSYGDDTWSRFIGLLASIIGIYYIVAAQSNLQPLIYWSIWARYYAVAIMAIFVFFNIAELPVLLFAAVDFAGATWTLAAFKQFRTAKQPGLSTHQ